MTYAHVFSLLRETHLSPEQLAKRMGISGMTIRRWQACPRERALPPLYERGFVEAVYQLVGEGRLSYDSRTVRDALQHHHPSPRVAITHLGCSEPLSDPQIPESERLTHCLASTGAGASRRTEVERGRPRINAFKAIGQEWASRIGTLLAAIASKRLRDAHKLVAYGALFYLLTPLDLIPDTVPVFGLVDDFAILGIATAYYAKLAARHAPRMKGG